MAIAPSEFDIDEEDAELATIVAGAAPTYLRDARADAREALVAAVYLERRQTLDSTYEACFVEGRVSRCCSAAVLDGGIAYE